MSIQMPRDYTCNESGVMVTVVEVVPGMSMIGPDYLEVTLPPGDFIVDFPDGSTQVISREQLLSDYTISNRNKETY